jgi:hypothetical protein
LAIKKSELFSPVHHLPSAAELAGLVEVGERQLVRVLRVLGALYPDTLSPRRASSDMKPITKNTTELENEALRSFRTSNG